MLYDRLNASTINGETLQEFHLVTFSYSPRVFYMLASFDEFVNKTVS